MNILEALAILESAVLESKGRNVATADAQAALDLLAPYIRPKLVVAQFRHHIAREHGKEHEKDGQQQLLRASFPGIRNSIRELIGQEMDELARDFPDTDDMELKNAIACLAKEYGKLGSRGCSWLTKFSQGADLFILRYFRDSPRNSPLARLKPGLSGTGERSRP